MRDFQFVKIRAPDHALHLFYLICVVAVGYFFAWMSSTQTDFVNWHNVMTSRTWKFIYPFETRINCFIVSGFTSHATNESRCLMQVINATASSVQTLTGIAPSALTTMFVIPENDDPYGVFMASREYNVFHYENTVNIVIERTRGLAGEFVLTYRYRTIRYVHSNCTMFKPYQVLNCKCWVQREQRNANLAFHAIPAICTSIYTI